MALQFAPALEKQPGKDHSFHRCLSLDTFFASTQCSPTSSHWRNSGFAGKRKGEARRAGLDRTPYPPTHAPPWRREPGIRVSGGDESSNVDAALAWQANREYALAPRHKHLRDGEGSQQYSYHERLSPKW